MVECRKGVTITARRLNKPRGIFSRGNRAYSYSHLRSFRLIPIRIPKLEYYSHSGIPVIPIGNPIPMVISSCELDGPRALQVLTVFSEYHILNFVHIVT